MIETCRQCKSDDLDIGAPSNFKFPQCETITLYDVCPVTCQKCGYQMLIPVDAADTMRSAIAGRLTSFVGLSRSECVVLQEMLETLVLPDQQIPEPNVFYTGNA